MRPMIRIALRNVLKSRKRSLLVASTIFISTLLLFLSDFTMNGVETQVLKGYVNLQSGDAAMVGPEIKGKRLTDPSKYINPELPDRKGLEARLNALPRMTNILAGFAPEVSYIERKILRFGKITKGKVSSTFATFNLSPEHRDRLLSTKTIQMLDGKLDIETPWSISICEEMARKLDAHVGDAVTLSIQTVHGAQNLLDFIVRGIQRNRAGYDNWYAFMSDADARAFLDAEPGFFDIAMIFLKNPGDAAGFAARLDARLSESGIPVGVEWWYGGSEFYPRNAQLSKTMFAFFIYVMLIIIALGLRASLRMNLFERMKEFGTMRAMGFSRFRCYAVIFSEIFIIAMAAYAAALVLGLAYAVVFGTSGIYIGNGAMSYGFGGERFWPQARFSDVWFAFIVIFVFSVFATMGPALKLNFQPITDTIAKRVRKVSAIREILTERRRRRLARQAEA